MAQINALLDDGQWEQAIETLQRLTAEQGEKLLPLDDGVGGFQRYLPLREVAAIRLAWWSEVAPAAVAAYRRRVDPLAERWYREAAAERDETKLLRIAEEMPASTWADDALFLLGEMALSRGDFGAAREAWERLSPLLCAPPAADGFDGRPWWMALHGADPAAGLNAWDERLNDYRGPPRRPVFPYRGAEGEGPALSLGGGQTLADIRARLALVSILEGHRQRAEVELALLRHFHPEAEGAIGGQSGKLADMLADLIEQSRAWPPLAAAGGWTTFAGEPARNGASALPLDAGGGPLWTFPLPTQSAARERLSGHRQRVAESSGELLSYHPLIAGDLVLINDATRIYALRAGSGEPAFPIPGADPPGVIYDAHIPHEGFNNQVFRPFVGVPRHTMTLHEGRLYARLGSPRTGVRKIEEIPEPEGFIVGLDLSTQKLLFRRSTGSARRAFEGSPLAVGSELLVVIRHTEPEDAAVKLYLGWLDALSGETLRERFLCGADSLTAGNADELTHLLPTLAGRTVIVNTNLGCVAALDAENGNVKWVVRYPRATNRGVDDNDLHFFRDLTPCLVHRGIVIAAPADCDRIFALRAATGELLWATAPGIVADAVHLLGATDAHVIASGDSLYWIDLFSGRLAAQFPVNAGGPAGRARPSTRGLGRGLLAGNEVYFPTREKIHVFRQTPRYGEPVPLREIDVALHHVRAGNLVARGDLLLIAAGDGLYALNPWGAAP